MSIGKNIKKFRKERGFTQKKLGELSGINEVQIRQYELGKANPKTETLEKIASALGVSTYELQGISTQDILDSLSETTAFYNYLHALGYEVHESPYNDKWILTENKSGKDIFISNEEMDTLERTTRENIDMRISYFIHDGKHDK